MSRAIRVLIVDDEPGICELVYSLINWTEPGMTFAGFAYNGIEAKEIIFSKRPEVVITDIRIPGIDGISLIRNAREAGFETKFIVISGFRDFEYAQQAIRLGAADYILKPIGREALNKALLGIVADIRHEESREDETARLNLLVRQQNAVLRKNELMRFVAAGGGELDESLFRFAAGGAYQFFVCKMDHDERADDDRIIFESLMLAFENELLDALRGKVNDAEAVRDDLYLYLLVNAAEPLDAASGTQLFQPIITGTQEKCEGICLTAGAGLPVYGVRDLERSLQTALTALDLRIILKTGQLIRYEDCAKLPSQKEYALTEPQRRELCNMLEASRTEDMCSMIRQIYRAWAFDRDFNTCRLYSLSLDIIAFVNAEAVSLGLREEAEVQEETKATLERVHNCKTIRELRECTVECLSGIFSVCNERKNQRDSAPVRVVKDYVESHIDKQISLGELAEIADLSPGYLSAFFKEKTGENLTDYIMGVRIEKAKELLRETGMSVAAISEEVGYADQKHFSKTFAKKVGLKPMEYRKFYSR